MDIENFDDILKKLLSAMPEVKAAAIVSREGLPIASVLPQRTDETRIAALSAALFFAAEMAIREMERGDFEQLYIKGSEGYLLVLPAGPNAVLVISTTSDVGVGLRFREAGGDFYPYPFIFKPPSPPGEAGAEAQLKPEYIVDKKEEESTPYCKHCGADLPKGQSICHVCGKKVI